MLSGAARAAGSAGKLKRGFTGLVGRLGRGPGRPTGPDPTKWMDPNAPIAPVTPVAVPPAFAPGVRGAIAQGAAARQAMKTEKAVAGQRPLFERMLMGVRKYPVQSAVVAAPFAALAAGLGREAISGAGQPDVNYGALTIPSERERYLTQVQGLGQTAYGMDPAVQRELQIQATLNAERAGKAYEDIGREDLAAAARQEVLGNFNQLMLANKLQQQKEYAQLLGKAQGAAAELPGTIATPAQIRETANQYASEYFALPEQDKTFYAERGYDTPEKFIQGRINQEI